MTHETNIELASTQTALAVAIGVSRQMVAKYLVRPDWPFGSSGPWSVDAVQRWRQITLSRNGSGGTGGDTEAAELRKQLLRERIRKLRRENDQLAERVIDRDEAVQELRAYTTSLRSAIMAATRSLPRTLETRGLLRDGARAEAKRITEDIFRRMCETFASNMKRMTEGGS
jgi:hypothetical protein